MSDQPLQPVTGRTGGGFSARLAALLAVGVMAALVWMGVAGGGPDPQEAEPTPPLVVVTAPNPAATARAVAPSASPPSSPPSLPLAMPHRHGPLGEDAFAVALWLEGRFYMSVLRESMPGHLGAAMRVPLYPEMPTTTVQLIQLWTREDRPPLAEIADYLLDLDALLAVEAPEMLLDATTDPRPRRLNAPRLVREGYELVVTSDVQHDHAFLLFNVRVGNAPVPETGSERLQRITLGWQDYGRRHHTFVLERSGPDAEGRDLTLWSCNDEGLTWAASPDCGARPSSMSPSPPTTRGTR
jgi:hypothetical protein